MKRFSAVFLLLIGVLVVQYTFAVPVSVVDNDLANTLEEEEDEDDDPVIEDDFTTHGLERLSSAATCLVAGVEYTHGQQIYRSDPCEFCLCLDGEMFCWWQDCPPTMEGPCRDRSPFSPCISVPANPKSTSAFTSSSSSDTTTKRNTLMFTNKITTKGVTPDNNTNTNNTKTAKISRIQIVSKEMPPNIAAVTEILQESSSSTEQIELSSESPEISTAWQPKHCTIMGKDYQIGDKLPHDTGNCLECICGPGAKVTCSPHQCAPAGDEINDYRMSGQRQPTQDIF